jgi:hypothetical protein
MVALSTEALATVSFWAVGKLAGSSQVAIKFNDLPPVLMSAEAAREFAAAVNAELVEVAPHIEPLLRVV